MDGQYQWFYQSYSATISFHNTFPPVSAMCQATLSSKWDQDDWATPIAHALVTFTDWNGKPAEGSPTGPFTGAPVYALAANGISELGGLLFADNCNSGAVINVFIWPSV